MSRTVADLLEIIQAQYPPGLAEPWDSGIGLTCGDPQDSVSTALLAVDVDAVTVAEAVEIGAQALVTHHPLLFRAVQSVAVDTAKGALVHRMIRSGIAHIAAHTNADKAIGGVNDALAATLGLAAVEPLQADAGPALDKIVTFVPVAERPAMIDALATAGAGVIGDYREAAFSVEGVGQFRPGPGATPVIGSIGRLEQVPESRIEMVLPRSSRAAVVRALLAAHPYAEPAFDVVELATAKPGRTGSGRVGTLEPRLTLAGFGRWVADRLPATVTGVRIAGDPQRAVHRVAVCGGAGAGLLGTAAAAGADVLVTSDLSHHVAAEWVAAPARPAIVEVAHWAGEWPVLPVLADVIAAATGGELATTVSTACTDPWTGRYPSPGAP